MENPQLIETDPMDSELEHRLRKIDEFDNRVLRVIINPKNDPIRVITLFFDRGMRNKL